MSASHSICAKDYWVAIVSTIVETANPEAEVQVALSLLGPIREQFVSVVDLYEPVDDGTKSRVFITKSYDATSHFETVTNDLKDVYKRYSGKPLTLDKKVRTTVEEEQKAMAEAQ